MYMGYRDRADLARIHQMIPIMYSQLPLVGSATP